jgi:hypothetical protein
MCFVLGGPRIPPSLEPSAEVVPMLRIFADHGELRQKDGRILYLATASGVQEVAVFAIFLNGTAIASKICYTVG